MMTPDDFREIALSLQDAIEGAHMGHPDFRANGSIFASLHTGDKTGMVSLTPEEQAELIKLKPAMFSPCAGAWGRNGSTNVILAAADKKTLRAAMNLAWQRVVSKPPPRKRAARRAQGCSEEAVSGRAPRASRRLDVLTSRRMSVLRGRAARCAGCCDTVSPMQSISLEGMSRRRFLALAGAAPIAAGAAGLAERVGLGGEGLLAFAAGKVPVGLELYSVRDELKKDPMATVRSVAKMGYEVVEFFSPYYDWTPQQAADMRKLMDDVGVKCLSTHNSPVSFTPDGIQKAIDLNHALGSKLLVMASAGRITTADGWKAIADSLNTASDKLTAAGLSAGYHNHAGEWHEVEGKRPMDILAGGTQERVVLQLDVGTCVEAGADPVAWINAHPGRIKSMHCKEWGGTEKGGYAALFGEGLAPWPAIFKAAEATGGIECYLIEQEEGPADQQLERAERCLANFRKLKAS